MKCKGIFVKKKLICRFILYGIVISILLLATGCSDKTIDKSKVSKIQRDTNTQKNSNTVTGSSTPSELNVSNKTSLSNGMKIFDELSQSDEINLSNGSETLNELETSTEMFTINASLSYVEETPISVPMPASDGSTDWECGTYCSDISVQNMEEYLQMLKQDGWNTMPQSDYSCEIAEGTSEYMFSKGNNILQIMMFMNDKEFPMCNSVLVKLDEGISALDIENRTNALSKEKALELIQPVATEYMNSGIIPSTKGTVTGLFEIFIDDLYEKMNIQAYAAISDNGFSGCFLVDQVGAYYVMGYLNNSCVADVDGNLKYELLDLSGFGSGIYRIVLTAYQYCNPIYFSSLTEVLQVAYSNAFVPDSGYAELSFKKVNDNTVKLVGADVDYGRLVVEGTTLVVENMEAFPFKEWSKAFDQNLLLEIEKEIPASPPEITVTVDKSNLDYIVQKTKWDGEEYNKQNAYSEIRNKEQTIPTIVMDELFNSNGQSIVIDFGDSIPDSVFVSDTLMDLNGKQRYSDREILERTVEIIDDSRVSFVLEQHMAYYLSSNSNDYEKDYYRLFRIVCTWGENECEYAFLIKTGKAIPNRGELLHPKSRFRRLE